MSFLDEYMDFRMQLLVLTLLFGVLLVLTLSLSWRRKKQKGTIGGVLSVLNTVFALGFLVYLVWYALFVKNQVLFVVLPLLFGVLLFITLYQSRKRKKEKEPIGCVLPVLNVVLSLCFVFVVVFSGYLGYIHLPKTELYRDETYDGHEFVIYEKGHPIFYRGNYHDLVVELNGEAMLQFVVQYHKDDLAVVPADIIVCKTDSVTDYTVEVYGAIMHFSADFQTIYELNCYETEILVDGLEIVHWEKRVFDLF